MPEILNLLPFKDALNGRQIAELMLIVFLLLFYSKLRKARVSYLILVAFIIFYLDIKHFFVEFVSPLYPYQEIAMVASCMSGIILWRRLNRSGFLVLLTIVFFSMIIDYSIVGLAGRGIFTTFLYNFHLLIIPILFFYLFYLHAISSFTNRYQRIYYFLVSCSYIVFGLEYLFCSDASHANNVSVVLFYTEMFIFSFISIARLVMDEENVTPLKIQPLFWIATGTLFNAIVMIPIDGLQPFLLDHYVEIYVETTILFNISVSAVIFQYSCYFIAMFLIARNPVPRRCAEIDPLKLVFNTTPDIKEPVLSPDGNHDNIFLRKK